MKRIGLLRLTLLNFKGIKVFCFEPQGQSVTVSGQNGSGKTSLADALNWLLFDKDSHGDKDFRIKPLEDGQEVHNIETKVGAVVLVDNEPMSITKVYKEVWRKMRGGKDKVFDGHTTDYYIDDVPLRKSDFRQRVASICDDVTFRLLTSITHFNDMHWTDRRRVVLDVCGDVSMPEVIGKHPMFDGLPGILGKLGVEDFLKKTKSARREASGRLEELPVRIDEAEMSKPELPGLTMSPEKLRAELEQARDMRAAMLAGDTQHLRDQIAGLEGQKREVEQRNERVEEEEKNAVKGLEHKRDKLLADKEKIESECEALDEQIGANKQKLDELRAEYREIVAEQWQGDGRCPTCDQSLPQDQVEHILKTFNSIKAGKKQRNQEAGKALARKNKVLEERKSGLVDRVAVLDQEIEKLNDGIGNRPDVETESTALVISQIAEIQQKIDSAATPDTEAIDEDIERLQTNLEEAEQRKAALSQIESIDKRIEMLDAERKKLASLIEEYDHHIYLCEEFSKARVSMLDGLVADKFAPYSFKMFDAQVNGGISDTCELLMDGKPYSTISTGEKIAAGLHVIEVLSEHYGVACPVFIDNAESLTLPVSSDLHQRIFLKVEDGVEELTVEQDEELVLIN